MHSVRGKLVDAGRDASLLGCRGSCCIPARLPYVSLPTLFPLPVRAPLLLGLQKGFWTMALATVKKGHARPPYVLPNAARRELAARCGQLRVPTDFGRALRCGQRACLSGETSQHISWGCLLPCKASCCQLNSVLLRGVTAFVIRAGALLGHMCHEPALPPQSPSGQVRRCWCAVGPCIIMACPAAARAGNLRWSMPNM